MKNQRRQNRIRRGMRRERREERQRNWAGEPLTLPKAKRQASAEANLRFNPLLRNIRGEMRASNQRVTQELPAWFGQLDQIMAQGQQMSGQASKAAQEALQLQLQTSQQGAAQNQAMLAGQNADFAKLVGADPTAFAQSAQEAAAATAQRGIAQNALAMPVIAAGASQAHLLAAQRGNAARDSIYQRLRERKRGAKIRQDLQAAQREKGLAKVEGLGKLREGEREFRIQQRAFPLKKEELAQQAREGAADRALDRAQFQETQRHNRATEQNARGDDRGGSSGLTPTQKRDAIRGQRSANITARSLYQAAAKKPSTPREWSAFIILVAKEAEGADQLAAKRAVNKLRQSLKSKRSAPKGPYAGSQPGLGE